MWSVVGQVEMQRDGETCNDVVQMVKKMFRLVQHASCNGVTAEMRQYLTVTVHPEFCSRSEAFPSTSPSTQGQNRPWQFCSDESVRVGGGDD